MLRFDVQRHRAMLRFFNTAAFPIRQSERSAGVTPAGRRAALICTRTGELLITEATRLQTSPGPVILRVPDRDEASLHIAKRECV